MMSFYEEMSEGLLAGWPQQQFFMRIEAIMRGPIKGMGHLPNKIL